MRTATVTITRPVTNVYTLRSRHQGFTLLEMLLSLGLMAMLMLATTQLMTSGAEIWNNSDRDIRAVENDKIALNFIRKMLQRAKPINWREANEDGVRSKTFVGKEKILYFAAPLPVAAAEELGIYLFALEAKKTDEYTHKALVVTYWQLNEESFDKTMENEAASEVIMTEVEQVNFSYFGDQDYSDGLKDPKWQEQWEMVRDFPLAVKMQLKRAHFDAENPDMAERMAWDGVVFNILQRSLR